MASEDELLRMIATRAMETPAPPRCPPADLRDIAEAERILGFKLPTLYVRLLSEVGNGGFGPGYGIIGVPPMGYQDEDLRATLTDAYLQDRHCEDLRYRRPRGLIYLSNWGCAIYSQLDCWSPGGRVVTSEYIDSEFVYTETSPNLHAWLEHWARGDLADGDLYETVGFREGVNPFTRQPMRFYLRRLKGAVVDYSDRMA